MRFKTLLAFLLAVVMTSPLYGQQDSVDTIQEAFLPFQTGISTEYRAASGAPGESYWQNSADYKINTQLHPDEHKVTTKVTIHYTNNSPQKMEFVWLKIDQNLFAEDSWGAKLTPFTGSRFGNQSFEGGINIKKIRIKQGGKSYEPETHLVDTNLRLDLKKVLEAKGGELSITINYSFVIPEYGSDRLGRQQTKNGIIYEVAQWYPRMAVFDDIKGWNTRPYLGAGEFYMEYGTFEYSITVPSEFIVVASGELQNPDEVLTNEQQKRLEKARNSDERVFIIKKDEVGTEEPRPQGSETLTWKFKIKNARDVAWAASKAFIWDAARINLPGEDQALAMSVYPVESAGQDAWGRSTEYVKGAIEFYSEYLFKYPYSVATNV
ncbi:MAG TPA: hypothetical protein VFG39_04155, partial [Balneolaceae bacterium]|nr:hypothetical protein [Balneolaceae bacterium]